jgi:hypothetical protein
LSGLFSAGWQGEKPVPNRACLVIVTKASGRSIDYLFRIRRNRRLRLGGFDAEFDGRTAGFVGDAAVTFAPAAA